MPITGLITTQSGRGFSRMLRMTSEHAKTFFKEASLDDALYCLKELFIGNGWTAAIHAPTVRETSLLLSDPKNPGSIVLIIRFLNNADAVSYERARAELKHLEETTGNDYACSQFALISMSGYEDKAEHLEKYNLLLQDWNSIEDLREHYSPDKYRHPRIQLFAHNKLVYKKVKAMMKTSNSVAVVQATGTGKSFLIAKLLQDFAGEKRLVMAPSHYVINQIKEHIKWEAESIEFMTYARSMNLSQADIHALKPKMIVMDEFHRCGAEEWGRGVQNILSAYPNAFKFGTSATPVRYLDNGRDMSVELFNGHVAENLSLAQAIVRNILPMPKYICALYTLSEEAASLRSDITASRRSEEIKRKRLVELDNVIIDWERGGGIPQVLKKHLKKDMRKFLIFCRDEEHLREMQPLVTKWFREAMDNMPVKTYKVYSDDANSMVNLENFKNDTSKDHLHLLFSINMLNEGLHVNEVSGVVLLRPTESPNIFYQQIGRCLKVGLNFRPVIFDFVNNFRTIHTRDFLYQLDESRAEWMTLRTGDDLEDRCPKFTVIDEVREITEVFGEIKFKLDNWEEMYERLVAFIKKNGHSRVTEANTEDQSLEAWVFAQRKRNYYNKLTTDQKKRLIEIGFDFKYEPKGAPTETWYDHLEKLKDHKKTHGHLVINEKKYPFLSNWIGIQRKKKREGKLSVEQIKLLEGIGFEWETRGDALFEKRMKEAKDFIEKNGHCFFPKGTGLEMWISRLRNNEKEGKLSPEHRAQLEATGIPLEISEVYNLVNRQSLGELENFHKKNGHCNVPEDNKQLFTWVSYMRKRKNKGDLPEPVISHLNKLGFDWNLPERENETKWRDRYQRYVKYSKQKGTTIVDRQDKDHDELRIWAAAQRERYKKGLLEPERIKKLNAINFVWDDSKQAYSERMIKKLIEYKEKYGTCYVPRSNKEYADLATWCSNMRNKSLRRRGGDKFFKRLDAIGFVWDPYEYEWQAQYSNLVKFLEKYSWDSLYKQNRRLNDFANRQRQQYNEGILSDERKKLLDKIGMPWIAFERQWKAMYNELIQYKMKYGNTIVPSASKKYPKLGNWVTGQRYKHRKGKLEKWKVDLLNKIGFVWNPLKKN